MSTFKKLIFFLFFTVFLYAKEEVSLQLLWKHQFEFAGFYMAKEKGFYEDAGLEVAIKEFDFGINIVDDVLKQKTDFGVGRSSLILDRLKGKDLILLNAIYQSSPYVLLSLQRPDLKKVEDFKGKRIMLSEDLASIAAISSMMKIKDIKQNSYEEIPHSFNIEDLIHNKTDLMTTYISNEPFHLKEKGIRYTIFDPKEYGFDFYEDILFTSATFLHNNKERVNKFQRASLKGWEYAFEHIDETIDVILKKYNTQNKTKDALLYEAETLKKLAFVEKIPFGKIDIERVKEIANIYRLLGMTQKSNEFLENIIYHEQTLTQLISELLTLELMLGILTIVTLFVLLSLYKQYILKNQNRELEKIVEEKTQELREANEHLEEKIAKRTEELVLATRAKSDFLANMSHEIRTPLNAIMGFIEILHRSEDDAKKQKRLAIIKESSHMLLNIINDILDFSKIESNKLSIEKIPLQFKPLFENTVSLFFDKAKERNITIKLFVDPNLPEDGLGDPTRIKQVFSNLLSNAIKFSHENSQVKVNVHYLSATNKLLCEVIDTGIGIEADKIERVFHCFEQANTGITRTHGGTGLGLSITKRLLELMNGEIGVESSFGEGSRFYFSLPILKNTPMKTNTATENFIPKNEAEQKILIVDDHKTNQLLLGMLLEEEGLHYDTANDGLEAIEALKRKKYSLILMDENMPNMSGKEATIIIREEYSLNQLPIVAVTANALQGDRERFLEVGMNDYLTKPIDAEALKKVLQRYLGTNND